MQTRLPDSPPRTPPCAYEPRDGPVVHVATQGSDSAGDGSKARPWASIAHAVAVVDDSSTILVHPGTYRGTVVLDSVFARGVTIRSAQRYGARLRTEYGSVVACYRCQGITIEGFDIAHSGPGAGPLVVHLGGPEVARVTVRNNIVHDSYDNDLLKINNGASRVTVERNIFYNQQGRDEHIDINSVAHVVVQDNVFLNDFAATGRENHNNTGSYIVIKDSNKGDDPLLGAAHIVVRRNVFLNWQGNHGANFVLVGEDGLDYIEARDVVIENNLMLGNSANEIRAPLGIKSGQGVVFRNNTVVGDMPGAAFAMRLNVENSAVRNDDIEFYNNIWADPTGTMGLFSTSPPMDTGRFRLDSNLYWNRGLDIPAGEDELITPALDGRAVRGDPELGEQSDLVVPVWQPWMARFGDGSRTTCGVFAGLVERYGTPSPGSAAVDAGRANVAPEHDILGNLRDSSPDMGAVEYR